MKNPQAFPAIEEQWYDEVRTGETYHPGMTLLDYFAGQALAGMLADPKVMTGSKLAKSCYNMADEMLKEMNRL